jgi:hypothetical protein
MNLIHETKKMFILLTIFEKFKAVVKSRHIPYILESNAHPNLMRTQFLATS